MCKALTKASLLFLVTVVVLMLSPAINSDASPKKVITFVHSFTSEEGAGEIFTQAYGWVTAAKAKFEAENPNVEVKLEFMEMGEVEQKIMTDYAAGVPHDVFICQSSLMLQHIATGDARDFSQYFNALPKSEQDDFTWHPTWSRCMVNGKLYALPLGLHVRNIAYRKDYFKAAGLNPNVTPKTLQELAQFAMKLNDPSKGIWGLGLYMGPSEGSIVCSWLPLLWSLGGDLWDPKTKMATYTDPAVIEMVQFCYDAVHKYKITPISNLSGMYNETALVPFQNGKYAMCFGIGNYWLADVQKAGLISGVYPPSDKVDDSKVGWFSCPEKNAKLYANSWNVAMYSLTKEPELAWKFIKCAVDKTVLPKFIAFGGFPSRLSSYQSDVYKAPFWQMWLGFAKISHVAPGTSNFADMATSFTQCVQEIISSGTDKNLKATLQKYQDEWNQSFGGR